MNLPVKEDTMIGASRGKHERPGTGRWRLIAWAAALSVALIGDTIWHGGSCTALAGEFSVNVRELDRGSQRLIVPLNRSLIVETSAPVTRAQVVESSIANVQSVSPTQFVITGVGYGTTQVMFWSNDNTQQVFEVDVELDLDRLNDMLDKIDPLAEATALSVNGSVVLTGTVSGPEAADRMTQLARLFAPRHAPVPELAVQHHLIVSGEQQVLLRVTVAEVARRATRALGVNGFLAGDDFTDTFVVSQVGGAFNPVNIGAAADTNVQGTIPFLTGEEGVPLSPSTTFSLGFPRVQMQIFLKAMADNQLLKVLAEPNLVAVSGETATFLAGGEFPIPVPQSGGGVGAITIEFREFGVRMNFTPVVLADQRIRLRVAPEVSETDFSNAIQIQGFVVPGLTQRRMETTVEVGNGQTLAVAGLLSEEVRGLANNIPGLGDVPILGSLFRSVEYQRRETELVMLVTPEIIAPMDPQQVPKVPGEDYTTPDDYQLYALGLLEGDPPEEGDPAPERVYETDTPVNVAPMESEPEELSVHGPWGYSTGEGG